MTDTPRLFRSIAYVLASTVVCAASAQAANEAQARYRQEMAICNSGQSNQAVGTCQLEARNALAESRRKGLTDPAGQTQHNILMRCNAHAGDDRRACELRMGAQGSMEGSVGAGGVLRQSTITIPEN